jgi:hypothetical protein
MSRLSGAVINVTSGRCCHPMSRQRSGGRFQLPHSRETEQFRSIATSDTVTRQHCNAATLPYYNTATLQREKLEHSILEKCCAKKRKNIKHMIRSPHRAELDHVAIPLPSWVVRVRSGVVHGNCVNREGLERRLQIHLGVADVVKGGSQTRPKWGCKWRLSDRRTEYKCG